MKFLGIFLIVAVLGACSNNEPSAGAAKSNQEAAKFLKGTENLLTIEGDNPILVFKNYAESEASKKIVFDKENINSLLKTASEYAQLVIIVEDHTIVKVENLDNCKASGSWGACMPFGEAYIKRGAFEERADYINQIIGKPDSQKRVAYLF